jgi:hypothetical protein
VKIVERLTEGSARNCMACCISSARCGSMAGYWREASFGSEFE